MHQNLPSARRPPWMAVLGVVVGLIQLALVWLLLRASTLAPDGSLAPLSAASIPDAVAAVAVLCGIGGIAWLLAVRWVVGRGLAARFTAGTIAGAAAWFTVLALAINSGRATAHAGALWVIVIVAGSLAAGGLSALWGYRAAAEPLKAGSATASAECPHQSRGEQL